MNRDKIFAIAISATVLVTIFATLVGPFNTQKSALEDKLISSAMQNTQTAITDYVYKNNKLPESIKDLTYQDYEKPNNDVKAKISYTKKSNSQYELCATFKTNTDSKSKSTNDADSAIALDESEVDSYVTQYQSFTKHPSGKKCYTKQSYSNSYSSYGSSYLGNSSSLVTSSKDTERQTDIKALHGQLEAYYAQNGLYPTYAELNSASWRTENLRGLDNSALKDPDNTNSILLNTPTKKVYSYQVSPTGCDNITIDCTTYTLTAYLSTGSTYTKKALN